MIIFQHISPEDLEKSDSGKWPAYILFTTAVGVLLLLNWLGLDRSVTKNLPELPVIEVTSRYF